MNFIGIDGWTFTDEKRRTACAGLVTSTGLTLDCREHDFYATLSWLYDLRKLRRRKETRGASLVCFRLEIFFEALFAELEVLPKDILFDLPYIAETRQYFSDTARTLYRNPAYSDETRTILLDNLNRAIHQLSAVRVGSFVIRYRAGKSLSVSRYHDQTGELIHGVKIYDLQNLFPFKTLAENVKEYQGITLTHTAEETAPNLLQIAADASRHEEAQSRAVALAALAADSQIVLQNCGLGNGRPILSCSTVAGQLLNKWDVKDEARPINQQNSSALLCHAFDCAYFAGRLEAFRLGHIRRPIFTYDLNSAYAWACTQLPQSGRWRHSRRWLPEPFSVWEISYQHPPDTVRGFLPHRGANGTTAWPMSGKTWIWQPELVMLLQHAPEHVKILRGFWQPFVPVTWAPMVKEVYDIRRRLADNPAPYGKIIKQILVCLYGKFAQIVGSAPFARRYYAGYITSLIRARLLAATECADQDLLYFGLDAIHTTRPLNIQVSDELGDWKADAFESGLYLSKNAYRLTRADGTNKTALAGWHDVSQFETIARAVLETGKATRQDDIFVGWRLGRLADKYAPDYLRRVTRNSTVRLHSAGRASDDSGFWKTLIKEHITRDGEMWTDYSLTPTGEISTTPKHQHGQGHSQPYDPFSTSTQREITRQIGH